jgi:hypothetical protein
MSSVAVERLPMAGSRRYFSWLIPPPVALLLK